MSPDRTVRTVQLVELELEPELALPPDPPDPIPLLQAASNPVLVTEHEAAVAVSWLTAAHASAVALRPQNARTLAAEWHYPGSPLMVVALDGSEMARVEHLERGLTDHWDLRWTAVQTGGGVVLSPLAQYHPAEIDGDDSLRDFALLTALRATCHRLLGRPCKLQ